MTTNLIDEKAFNTAYEKCGRNPWTEAEVKRFHNFTLAYETAKLAESRPTPCDADFDDPVHRWFCLSYCAYAIVPRSIAQSMPVAWQRRFVRLMNQMNALCERAGISTPGYQVHGKKGNRFVHDPYRDYQRGRRDVFKEVGYEHR